MAGTKRKQTATKSSSSSKPKQSKKSGQKTVSSQVNVPIDEGFAGQVKGASNVSVYIDEAQDIIYDVSLNQTNIGNNANKFYRLQIIQQGKTKFFTHCRWGRVGEFGQVKVFGPFGFEQALAEFEKKFKDKSGLSWEQRAEEPKKGKYTFIEKNYEEDSDNDANVKKEESEAPSDSAKDEVKSELPIQTQRLVELIFNENHFNSVLENIGYNQDKLPLGKLGKGTLKKGFEHLKELASLIKHPSLGANKYKTSQQEAIEDFTNRYYSTIPHVFGRDRPPLINNHDILQKEIAMLDTLTDMEIANTIMKTTSDKSRDSASVSLIDKRYNQLGMEEMIPLDHKSKEYKMLQEYLINTSGATHNIRYRLQDIFRISRNGEDDRFNKSEFANRQDSCRCLLWHGSRTTNFGGILSQGLRIAPPEAPVSGYAFGKGIYLADISTKSANYCMASSSGGHGLLLLCEAELGRPMYEILQSDTNAGDAAIKAQCIATKGIGRTVPQGWVDAGSLNPDLKGCMMPDAAKKTGQQTQHPSAYLEYNEYICYNVAQIRLRYLFRFAT